MMYGEQRKIDSASQRTILVQIRTDEPKFINILIEIFVCTMHAIIHIIIYVRSVGIKIKLMPISKGKIAAGAAGAAGAATSTNSLI